MDNEFNDWPWREWANYSLPSEPADVLQNHVPQGQVSQRIALRSPQRNWNWVELRQYIDWLAASFQVQGVTAGSGVALRGKNSESLLMAYLALLQCGARVLPLNPQLPVTLLDTLLPHLTLSYWLNLDAPVAIDLCKLKLCQLTMEQPAQSFSSKTEMLLKADKTEKKEWLPKIEQQHWEPARPVTLTLTSGSSGLPKAAAHSTRAHLVSAQGVLGMMPFVAGDSWLLSLPLFHVSGQGIVWRWLQAGATLVVRETHPLGEALKDCTHASLVPTQLWRLLKLPIVNFSLKEVLLGGAVIPVELAQAAQARGIRCWCGYGMTEMASTVTAKRADSSPGVGTALKGREIRVENEEVLIRSASSAEGYWWDGELKPICDSKGWYHSRDRGFLKKGELYIVGRLDNLFFSGGEGIQPEEIERVLCAHPQVSQAFILPKRDVEFGHRPVAIIEAPEIADLAVLTAWLENKLPRYQLPIMWLRLPQELKNSGIKLPRQWVAQWFHDIPFILQATGTLATLTHPNH